MRQPLATLLAGLAILGGALVLATSASHQLPLIARGLGAVAIALGVVVAGMVAGGQAGDPSAGQT